MPLPLRYMLIGAGTALVLLGFLFMRWAREADDLREPGSPREDPSGPGWLEGWSSVRRSAVGLVCLVAGYHLVAYGTDRWLNFIKVLPEHLWLLVVGSVIGVVAPTIADGASAARCWSCGARLGPDVPRCPRCGAIPEKGTSGSE